MKKLAGIFLTLLLPFVFYLPRCLASAPDGYQNPILRGMNPDPSIIRVGSAYYMVTSSFEYFPGCPIYYSLDLVHWKRIGYALSRSSQYEEGTSGSPSLYAATLRYHEGTFYLVTTDVRGRGNFLITASDPAGPWSDPIYIDKGMFDPSLLFADDGKVYYTRRGPGKGENIIQAEIDVRTGKLLTPLRTISTGMVTDDAEGPHLYHINGWYYLSQAEGGTRFLHMQTIGRSRSPWGPFESCPWNPWLSQHNSWGHTVRSTGHADLVQDTEGQWWTVYLGTRHASSSHFSIAREAFLAPVVWRDGWPTVTPEDIYSLPVHAKTLPAHPWAAEPEREDFNSPALATSWNRITPFAEATYSLSERPGYLRLHGGAPGLRHSPGAAFVGRRQTEWRTNSETKMEFTPASENEEAGIAVFMKADYHYEIFTTMRNHQTVVALRKSVGDIRTITAQAVVSAGPLLLRIDSDAEQYRFSYGLKDGSWKLLGSGLTKLIANEVAEVWTGVYIGMYSTGNGQKCVHPADFDWFGYVSESK